MNNQPDDAHPIDILVVDDDPDSLRLLMQLLSQAGYKVRPARDGYQALSATRLVPPDLILLDVMMSGMSGYEVCEALKADEATRNIPVIFTSGLNQIFDKVRAFSIGGVDYVNKPFQNEEILARVKTHVTLHKLQQALHQRNAELEQEISIREQAELQLQETNDALQQRLLELTILNFIAQTLTTVTDIKTALATVVQVVGRLFNASCAAINLLDPVSQEIYVIGTRGVQITGSSTGTPANRANSGLPSQAGETPLTLPINYRHLLEETSSPISSPPQTGPVADSMQCLFETHTVQEYLFVPLQARNEVIGLLGLARDRLQQEFFLAEEHLVATIAGQIAGAVKITHLFEQERRQAQLAESLRQVATVLSSSLDRSTILDIIFEQLQQVLPYDGATIGLIMGDELVFVKTVGSTVWQVNERLPLNSNNVLTQVLQQRQVVSLANVAEGEYWPVWFKPHEPGSWMGAPLEVGRTVRGLLTIKRDQVGAYHPEDAKILQTFASQAALAIENARLYEQAQTVAVDAERQRMARELHDSVTQSLYSLSLFANGWATTAQQGKSDVPQMIKQLKQLEEISLQGLKEMRLLLHQLRPPILKEVGLIGALQQRLDAVEHRVNIETRLLVHGPVDELSLALEEQLFAISQESLTNILRHADATEVIVMLRLDDEQLALTITDNGIGFDPVEPSFGLGLDSIRERVAAIGGQVEITSLPHQGTTVMVTIILKPEERVYSSGENKNG